MTLADNVALMKDGKILQYDTPSALYETPATEFAGWFLGNPGMNFPPAVVSGTGVKTPLASLPLSTDAASLPSGDYRIGVRPEHVDVLVAPRPAAYRPWCAT